jgi:hypothetical protein
VELLHSIPFENIIVPTIHRCYIQNQIRVRRNATGGQWPIARLAVEAELGSHRADGVEGGEGAIYVPQDGQHPGRVWCNEGDEPITSRTRSRICRPAVSCLEIKARSLGAFTSNMKTFLSSSRISKTRTESVASRDRGQYWGTTVGLVSEGGKVVKDLVVGTVKVGLRGVGGHFFELASDCSGPRHGGDSKTRCNWTSRLDRGPNRVGTVSQDGRNESMLVARAQAQEKPILPSGCLYGRERCYRKTDDRMNFTPSPATTSVWTGSFQPTPPSSEDIAIIVRKSEVSVNI